MKKTISIIAAVVLILCTISPVISYAVNPNNKYPTILVEGRGTSIPIYSLDGEQVFPIEVDTEYIADAYVETSDEFMYGILTGDYTVWAQKVADYVETIFEKTVPDKNGEITDGSAPEVLSGYGYELCKDGCLDYKFKYDWRFDPCYSAEKLNEYIQLIKEYHNCEKVSLCPRCYGANVVSAYLYKYGHDDIDTVIYYCGTQLGCYTIENAFIGNFELNTEELEEYMGDTEVADSQALTDVLASMVSLLNQTGRFDSTIDCLQYIIDYIAPILSPYILRVSYARYTSFWSMVGDKYYEKAKDFVFSGYEKEFEGLIDKIDNYHYNVQVNLIDMLKKYRAEGLRLIVIVKYNSPFAPVFKGNMPQGDDTVTVAASSFGATAAPYGETLSDEYISTRNSDNISSDHIIDSSTCAFPECTVFIKDMPHSAFTPAVNYVMNDFCNEETDFVASPYNGIKQFNKFNPENGFWYELTDEPEPQEEKTFFSYITDYFVKLYRFIKSVFLFIPRIIKENMAK